MFKAIIVDDEVNIRDGLKCLISWEDYGFTICGVARNGLEAAQLIAEQAPELVITDIKMPGMDGLQLIQHVKSSMNKDIQFIILSGYSEFDYARKAIEYKVKSYLLKPVEEDELCKLLVEIKTGLEERLRLTRRNMNLFFQDLIRGKADNLWEFNHYITDIRVKQGIQYIFIELDEDETIYSRERKSEMLSKRKSFLIESIQRLVGQDSSYCIVEEGLLDYGLVVGYNILRGYNNDIRYFAQLLHDLILHQCKINTSIFVGQKVKQIEDIPLSRNSAELCRVHKFYQGVNSVIFYEDIKNIAVKSCFNDNGILNDLMDFVDRNDKKGIEKSVDQICSQLSKEMVSIDLIKMYMNNIVLNFMKAIADLNGDSGPILARYSLLKDIENRTTLNKINTHLKEFCLLTAECIESLKKNKSLGVVGNIIDYVKAHYHENIDLKDIAETFYLHPSYLGQLFKKKTGIPFNRFLHTIRIEEAKRLLSRKDMKIYEVAKQVGYDDPNYFAVKFEEIEHITPTRYKEGTMARNRP